MPIFDYKCKHCGHQEENHIVKTHDTLVVCPKCNRVMSQKISKPNLGRMNKYGSSV